MYTANAVFKGVDVKLKQARLSELGVERRGCEGLSYVDLRERSQPSMNAKC